MVGKALGLIKTREREYKSVFITGASVGIGAGFAKEFAREGVHMTLTAYSKGSLENTIEECKALGAIVTGVYVDVKDTAKMEELINQADDAAPLDLVIANAGITARIDGLRDSPGVFNTNLTGLLNTLLPAIRRMRPRKQGKLILMSSLGGHAPASNLFMTPYIATKAAIKAYGEGLRASLGPEGIEVSVMCPGFTESRMTREQTKQGVKFYLLWSLEKAIRFMRQGMDANEGEISFPFPLYVAVQITGNLPSWLRDLMLPLLIRGDPYYVLDKRLQEAEDDDARELIIQGKHKED